MGARLNFYRRVFGYFRPNSGKIFLLLAVIGLSTTVGLAQVWPLAILVDGVLTPSERLDGVGAQILGTIGGSVSVQIAVLAGATFFLRMVQELFGMARSLLNAQIAHSGILRVRCDLFRKLQALSLDYHRSQPQGDTIYRLIQDTPGCQQILGVWIEVVVAAFTLVIMLSIMFARNVELTLVALAVVPLLLACNYAFGKCLREISTAARAVESQFTSTAQRSVAAMMLVQAFRRESCEFGRFRLVAGSSADAWAKVQRQMSVYRLCVGMIFGGGAAIIFGYGGHLVWQAQSGAVPSAFTVGDLMVFLTYLAMFYDPLCKISGAGANMQQGVAGMERVFEVLDRTLSVRDAEDAVELPCQPRTLRLEDVGFSYPGGKPVLQGVSVAIRPGEMVAFVGSSGVGKSTLLNLLPRFFDPTAGAVKLDDMDLRRVQLSSVRRHVALVLQENPILPTTIEENITYGHPEATPDQVRWAAEMAGADQFIDQLPDGYQSQISEAGQNLSGGQRQSPSPGRCSRRPRSSCSMSRPAPSTHCGNGTLLRRSIDLRVPARSCSSAIASARSSAATAFMSSTKVGSSSRARITRCSSSGAITGRWPVSSSPTQPRSSTPRLRLCGASTGRLRQVFTAGGHVGV